MGDVRGWNRWRSSTIWVTYWTKYGKVSIVVDRKEREERKKWDNDLCNDKESKIKLRTPIHIWTGQAVHSLSWVVLLGLSSRSCSSASFRGYINERFRFPVQLVRWIRRTDVVFSTDGRILWGVTPFNMLFLMWSPMFLYSVPIVHPYRNWNFPFSMMDSYCVEFLLQRPRQWMVLPKRCCRLKFLTCDAVDRADGENALAALTASANTTTDLENIIVYFFYYIQLPRWCIVVQF